jgi:hypothetical protein
MGKVSEADNEDSSSHVTYTLSDVGESVICTNLTGREERTAD